MPTKQFTEEELKIFSLDAIHKEHWRAFCDVCYPRFGFEEEGDGERTYEQKYDTFRHCHNFAKEMFDWDVKEMLKVHEHDFKRFKQAYELFNSLTTEDNACIPMVLVLLRMQQSIWNRLKEDGEMIEFIYPRKCEVDYNEFKIEAVSSTERDRHLIKDLGGLEKAILDGLYKERSWDEEWAHAISESDIHHTDTYLYNDKEEEIEWDDDAGSISQTLARCILGSYNYSLEEFANKYNNVFSKGGGNVIKAITFRLFTTYQISLAEVKAIFEDYPEGLCFSKLTETREELISEFRQTRLGKHWCECIMLPKGLEKVGKYLINHRDSISEEEEARFFYLLDEICIITDILKGNASRYWLNVDYSVANKFVGPAADGTSVGSEGGFSLPLCTLDTIFHRALNVARVKEAIRQIVITRGEAGRHRLSLKQWFVVHKVLEEIGWLDDDTDTRFIEWIRQVFQYDGKTCDFKSVKSEFKHSHSSTWGADTVKDRQTGREYRALADYVRSLFVTTGSDGSIHDREEFMNLGSDGKPMYIGRGLRKK